MRDDPMLPKRWTRYTITPEGLVKEWIETEYTWWADSLSSPWRQDIERFLFRLRLISENPDDGGW